MDYYKNSDLLCDNDNYSTISGTQYSIITDIVTEPVSLEFFKQHARIDFDMDDNLILVYIKAARIYLERWAMISFGPKQIGLTASCLPDKYKLMYGPVSGIVTTGYTNLGDLLSPGGNDIDIQFTTLGVIDDVIRVAICRYAAGLYINRENVIDSKLSAIALMDQSKMMLEPYRNIIIF